MCYFDIVSMFVHLFFLSILFIYPLHVQVFFYLVWFGGKPFFFPLFFFYLAFFPHILTPRHIHTYISLIYFIYMMTIVFSTVFFLLSMCLVSFPIFF